MAVSLLCPGTARCACLLLVGTIVFVVTGTSAAQSPGVARIGSMFVTATRMAQPIEQLIADVTILDADEIARSGAQSLAELLQRQAGVEIIQNGGPGSTSGVFIRGANRGQTLLLIDGLRVSSASVGAPSLEAVPLGQVERIEILRGPASSLYGADAIGGVIQIFTRTPEERFTGNASAGYGTYHTRTLSAGLSGGIGAVRFSVQAGGRRSDGFNATTDAASFIFNPDRDGYESDDLGLNATLTFAPGHEATFQVLRNRLDAQFDGGPDFDDRTLTTLETWRVESRNRFHERWTSRLSAGESRDDSISKGAFGDFPFRTRQRQYAWQNDIGVPMGNLSLAIERREERIDEDAGFPVRERNTNSVTGVWQFRHEGHALQANLRHDRSDQYGGETTGALAWGWQFAPDWRFTASYGTAFKPPSFNDLYFPGFSNPTLEPERSRNVEAGLYWKRAFGDARVEARAVGWRNEVDDLIVFQCDASFNCLPQNVANATLTGVTLGVDASWRDTTLKASLDLQDPTDDATGHLLPRRAKQHGAVVLTQRFGPVRVGIEVVASAHRFDDAENLRRLAGYGIVNLTAEWQAGKGVTMFVRGDNVADRDYALASGFATGGAQAFVGVRWQP
jgi:vitamin B12 transporter